MGSPRTGRARLRAVLATLASAPLASASAAECPRFALLSDGLPTARAWQTYPALGDVDGDGRADLAALLGRGRRPGVWSLEPSGRWRDVSLGLAIPGRPCGAAVALADANGDGHLDLGLADRCLGLFVFLGGGDGTWRMTARPPGARTGRSALAFGDLDSDGHADLVATGSSDGGLALFRGDGRGGWEAAEVGLPKGFGNDVALGDIDGDGRLDIASAFATIDPGGAPASRQPVVWLGHPSGRFRDASHGLPDEGGFRAVALGDVDGDGRLDLAISAGPWPGRPPLLVFRNDGERGWRAAAAHPQADPDQFFEGTELADLDRDGNLDLVAVSHGDAGLRVWRGDGRGGFGLCRDTGLPSGRAGLRGWGLAVGDVDGDGRPDLAAGFGRRRAGGLEVWVQR